MKQQHEILTVEGHTKSILDQLTLLAKKLVASRRYFKEHEPEKEKQFCDINFHKLIKDPLGTVKSIYSHFGYEFTAEFEMCIKEYLENQPRKVYGRAPHSLNNLATTEEEVESLFADYINEFSSYLTQ